MGNIKPSDDTHYVVLAVGGAIADHNVDSVGRFFAEPPPPPRA